MAAKAMTGRAPAERFAELTDALLRGATLLEPSDLGEEFALAARLRAEAGGGVADPAFFEELRSELVAKAAARRRTQLATLRYATMESPIGPLGVAHRDGLVVYCTRFDSADAFERGAARTLGALPERDPALPEKLERGIRDHLEGRKRFTAVDLSWLPPFQRRVLETTAQIPRGEVRPYGWIAREIGSPGATRAVGTALGHNPIPFIIPCHRVVRSDGTLGEYSGGGPAMKVKVLELEGAPVEELLDRARRGERLLGCTSTHIVCYPSCHAARRARRENTVPFISVAQAHSSGYRPCKLCRPA
jgi:O-6-methylguanine DNA methyltransferase